MTFKEHKGDCGFGCGSTDLEKNTCGCYNEWMQQKHESVIDAMREAFEAGSNWATEYEHGSRGYYPNFNLWVSQNADLIGKIING